MPRTLQNKGRINRPVNLPVDRPHCDRSIPTNSPMPKVAAIIGPLPNEFTEREIRPALRSRITLYIATVIAESRSQRLPAGERARQDQ